MSQPVYPLEQLMSIKNRRFEQAVKTLEEKKQLLRIEEEKLQQAIQEKEEVLLHKKAKIQQLREALDKGTTSDKIQQMKIYLKFVDERLLEKERNIFDQQKKVDKAQSEVEVAQKDLYAKKKDLEKLEMHKAKWLKGIKVELEQVEASEQDELGSTRHLLRKIEKRGKKS